MNESKRCTDRECKEAKRYLRLLIKSVEAYVKMVDAEMKKPSSVERGERIAELTNSLDMSKDIAKRFGVPDGRKKSK